MPADRQESTASEELVVLGVVTRPHGVRGEVRVHRFNPDSELMLELKRVRVRQGAGVIREVAIRSSKRSGDADVLSLEGSDRHEDAEALRGAEIVVPRSWLPALPPGEVYHADLVGMRVTEGGVELGEVLGIEQYPSTDCLRVRCERGVIEIPLIEPYLVAIDVAARVIEVAHSEDFEPERS